MAAKAMYAGLELLKPLLIEGGSPDSRARSSSDRSRATCTTSARTSSGIMLTGAGFEVIDLGNDVAPERFVGPRSPNMAPVIGMSALLTTTMSVMKQVVELTRERGLSERVKIIVGGAPVSAQFAKRSVPTPTASTLPTRSIESRCWSDRA